MGLSTSRVPTNTILLCAICSAIIAILLLIYARYRHTHNDDMPLCVDKQIEFMSLASKFNRPGNVHTKTGNTTKVQLHYVDGVFGCLYIDLHLNGTPTIFFVDTGYAGPPVINPWHQAREEHVIESIGEDRWALMSIAERLAACDDVNPDALYHNISNNGQSQFINRHMCSTYASACTMRLAGIASDKERVTDIVLCPELIPKSKTVVSNSRGNHPEADILVTIPVRDSVHILTIDYLKSYTNFKLYIERVTSITTLVLGPASPPIGWMPLHTKHVHGALAIRLDLGVKLGTTENQQNGWFTLDTGSSAPLAINESFSTKFVGYTIPITDSGFVQQSGINNEMTCARVLPNVLVKTVTRDGINVTSVNAPVLCNDADTIGVDGYVGLAMIAEWEGVFFDGSQIWIPPNNLTYIKSSFFDDVASKYCNAHR